MKYFGDVTVGISVKTRHGDVESYQSINRHCSPSLRKIYCSYVLTLLILKRNRNGVESIPVCLVGRLAQLHYSGTNTPSRQNWRFHLAVYVLIFQRKHKHVFTSYVIPSNWHNTGSWNPSSCKTMTYPFYLVKIIMLPGHQHPWYWLCWAGKNRSQHIKVILVHTQHSSYQSFANDSCFTHNGNMTWKRLTHWGRVTHICVGNLTIIGSDNGLSPGRRQAITWTNVGI